MSSQDNTTFFNYFVILIKHHALSKPVLGGNFLITSRISARLTEIELQLFAEELDETTGKNHIQFGRVHVYWDKIGIQCLADLWEISLADTNDSPLLFFDPLVRKQEC